MNTFIIKKMLGYYTLVVDEHKKTVKVYDTIDSGIYEEDIQRLIRYDKTLAKINKFTLIKNQIKTNFQEAEDIIAIVMFMIMNVNIQTHVDELDIILMSDLIKTYVDLLLQYQSYRLKYACYYVNITKSSDALVEYDEKPHTSLRFLDMIMNDYNYDVISCKPNQRKCYARKFDELSYEYDDQHQLKGEQMVYLIHFINQFNHNIIDPGNIYKADTFSTIAYIKISEDGVYYFPVCDRAYKHWTLWEVDYKDKDRIIYNIYDSLSIYDKDENSRDAISTRIAYFFRSYYEEEYHIIKTAVKQNERDVITCGYYTLFFLGARLKNINIDSIPHIERFNI